MKMTNVNDNEDENDQSSIFILLTKLLLFLLKILILFPLTFQVHKKITILVFATAAFIVTVKIIC